ncbi:MAG: AraC family transcriptional regulator [Sphingomonadales bacterium]|nr:MAG: AraC family transcriptional regulator [Sphingomonadales bacterium]
MRQCISRRQFGGLSVERVVYSWSRGDVLKDVDPALTLKLKYGNSPVRARHVEADGSNCSIGRLVLTPPQIHVKTYAVETEPGLRASIYHFDSALVQKLLKQADTAINLDDLQVDLDIQDSNIEASLLRLASEVERFGNTMAIEAMIRLLIVDLARYVSSGLDALSNGGLKPSQIKLIDDFINSFEIGLPRPAEVARECGMSPTHLRRLFKKSAGESLQDYLKTKLMDRAKTLLAEEDLPLKIVSYRLGFNHCSAFSFAFRQATGETPGQYRRRTAQRLSKSNALETAAFAATGG